MPGLRINHAVETQGGGSLGDTSPRAVYDEIESVSTTLDNELESVRMELDRTLTRNLYGQEIKKNMAKRIKMIEDHMQVLTSVLQNAPSLEAAQKIAADISAFRGASEELGRWISGNF